MLLVSGHADCLSKNITVGVAVRASIGIASCALLIGWLPFVKMTLAAEENKTKIKKDHVVPGVEGPCCGSAAP